MSTMTGYVRVSKVAGREGDSYGSPKEQEQSIRQWAKGNNVTISEIVTEEDVSGARKAADRKLGPLIEAVEEGRSNGIVTYRLSRFGRSLVETLTNVERIKQAGGRLVCVADGIDSSTPSGKLLIGVLGTLAEVELDQRREYWDASARRAIERGVHTARAPLGYFRDGDGRLQIDHETSTAVVQLFQKRAEGDSWRKLADWLSEEVGRSLGTTAVQRMIRTRTYRGEAHKGIHVNPDAHTALVTEAQWQAAQWEGTRPDRNGSVASQGILAGLVVCAACGKPMSTNSGKHGQASYYCNVTRIERCPAPAAGLVRLVDELVEPLIVERLADDSRDFAQEREEHARLQRVVLDAHQELTEFVRHARAADLGALYAEEIAWRREAVRAAEAALFEHGQRMEYGTPDPDQWLDLPIEEKRKISRSLIESVAVTRSNNGRWQPISERVAVMERPA